MKRGKFIRLLIKSKCVLLRHGNRHDVYINKLNGKKSVVPRHPEIKELLVKEIMKQLEI
ncbi:MAG: addiction module toxin, HicA family [Chlamydiae bacterium]|nr:MAG: addiction module toxin, HicA family [Chlamydiota bacterium]